MPGIINESRIFYLCISLEKVKLPKTVFKDVSLDVTEQAVCVQVRE